jgi:addiction module RelE/StbE family toxin
MEIQYLQRFKKQFKKLHSKIQDQFEERLRLFITNPNDPRLRIHPLKGNYQGYWSMNVNGDIRAIYTIKEESIIIFGLIGSHSQLY